MTSLQLEVRLRNPTFSMSEATNQGVFLSTAWSSQLSVDHSQGPVMGELSLLLLKKEGHHGEPRQGLHNLHPCAVSVATAD